MVTIKRISNKSKCVWYLDAISDGRATYITASVKLYGKDYEVRWREDGTINYEKYNINEEREFYAAVRAKKGVIREWGKDAVSIARYARECGLRRIDLTREAINWYYWY